MSKTATITTINPPREREEIQLELSFELQVAQVIPFNEPVEWSDRGILELREVVLSHALRDAVRKNDREAQNWIISDEIAPFSFRVCCGVLGLDAEEVRSGVMGIIKRSTKH